MEETFWEIGKIAVMHQKNLMKVLLAVAVLLFAQQAVNIWQEKNKLMATNRVFETLPLETLLNEAREHFTWQNWLKFYEGRGEALENIAHKIYWHEPLTEEDLAPIKDEINVSRKPLGEEDSPKARHHTLLVYAMKVRNLQAVEVLLSAGADPLVEVRLSSRAGPSNFLDKLLTLEDIGAQYDTYLDDFQLEAVSLYLKHGGSPNVTDAWGSSTLLRDASFLSKGNVAKLLIDHGADPWWQGERFSPPIYTFLSEKDWYLVDYLLEKEAFVGGSRLDVAALRAEFPPRTNLPKLKPHMVTRQAYIEKIARQTLGEEERP